MGVDHARRDDTIGCVDDGGRVDTRRAVPRSSRRRRSRPSATATEPPTQHLHGVLFIVTTSPPAMIRSMVCSWAEVVGLMVRP